VCSQACQFDMKCSPTTPGTCVGWGVGESGSCNGVDVTAPTTCSVANGRNVTVCNRGTVAAPAGIDCYLFPGNSQHMPEATPDIAAGAQSAGPLFPSTNAAVGATESWSSPDQAYAADGVSMTATPSTTTTTNAVTKSPTADDSSLGSAAYTNDGNVGTVSI